MIPTPSGDVVFTVLPQPNDPTPTYYTEYDAQYWVIMEWWTLPHQVVEIRERIPETEEMGP